MKKLFFITLIFTVTAFSFHTNGQPINPYSLDYSNPNCSEFSPQEKAAVYADGYSRGAALRNYLKPQYEHLVLALTGTFSWSDNPREQVLFIDQGEQWVDIISGGDGFNWVAPVQVFVPQVWTNHNYTISYSFTLRTNELLLTSYIANDPALQNNLQNIETGDFPPYNIQCPHYKSALFYGFLAGAMGLRTSP